MDTIRNTRLLQLLQEELGPTLQAGLENLEVDEILVNADGAIWLDGKQGLVAAGEMAEAKRWACIQTLAGWHERYVDASLPYLEVEFPKTAGFHGERFSAQIPPLVEAPCFTIRKRARHLYTLQDYVDSQRLTDAQQQQLEALLQARANIVVVGGPGSGKTTFTNALLQAAVSHFPLHRFLLLEDVPELQCRAKNHIAYQTSVQVSMAQLVKMSLRMRPDHLIVGEIRGAEALDLLKAWNTGCPGGLCTVHANGAREALQRLADLALEAGLLHPPKTLIAQTIDALVFVTREGGKKGMISEIFITPKRRAV